GRAGQGRAGQGRAGQGRAKNIHDPLDKLEDRVGIFANKKSPHDPEFQLDLLNSPSNNTGAVCNKLRR
ncbi:MAG: hypothetical protein RRY23_05600, partial [Alistipes sp.]